MLDRFGELQSDYRQGLRTGTWRLSVDPASPALNFFDATGQPTTFDKILKDPTVPVILSSMYIQATAGGRPLVAPQIVSGFSGYYLNTQAGAGDDRFVGVIRSGGPSENVVDDVITVDEDGSVTWGNAPRSDLKTGSFAGAKTLLIATGDGKDYVNSSKYGGSGDDTRRVIVIAGQGDDDILTGSGNDTIYGNGGNDLLAGGSGDDLIDGGGDVDVLFGDDLAVTVSAPPAPGTGGATGPSDPIPSSIFTFGHSIRYAITQGNRVVDTTPYQQVRGSGSGDDILVGGTGRNFLVGGAGADRLFAGVIDLSAAATSPRLRTW